VFFAEPARTQFDLNFSVLGIPVRVHPLVLVSLPAVGWRSRRGSRALQWMGVV